MGLFEWGEKRFARGITKAMIHSYLLLKANYPNLNERELVREVLSTRPGNPAKEILKDMDDSNFWQGIAGESFIEVIYILVRMEYVEYMKGTLDTESVKTNAVFKEVIQEEMKKVGLSLI